MAGRERPQDDPRGRRMFEFAQTPPSRGVNNYCLKGPLNVPTYFKSFVALFPTLGATEIAASSFDPATPAASVYATLSRVTIPQRIQDLHIGDEPEARRASQSMALFRGTPSIMAGIGTSRDTQEEVIMLWAINGIAPETALKELQQAIRDRQGDFN